MIRLLTAWLDAAAAWLELVSKDMREKAASFDDSMYGKGYADAIHDLDTGEDR